jgi:large subunit ribosomal protein L13
MSLKESKIDATGQTLGRLASQVAVLLRGKNDPSYTPGRDSRNTVIIENIDQIKVTGRKMQNKKYYNYSGYPGGLRVTSLAELVEKKGWSEVMTRAVWNMLPKNKLRSRQIKRLLIK